MRFKEYRLSLTIIAVLVIVGFSLVQTYAGEAVPGSGVTTTIMQSWENRYYPNYPQPGTPLRMQGESPAYEAEADNMEELASVLGAAFVQREISIQVLYTGASIDVTAENAMRSLINSILDADDYLKFSMQGCSFGGTGTEGNFTINLTATYLTTLDQETYVEQRVTEILSAILDPGMNTHQIVKAIHDYIVLNVAYDTTLTEHSAYAALYSGETVCQGYSLLAYKMLVQAGLPARIIGGTAGIETHAWNMVEIEGQWYYLDCTWDDPVPDEADRVIYTYYNLSNEEISIDHQPDPEYVNLPQADILYLDTLNALIQANPDNDIYPRLWQQLGFDYLLPKNTAADAAELESKWLASAKQSNSRFMVRYNNSNNDLETLLDGVGLSDMFYRIAGETQLTGFELKAGEFKRGGTADYYLLEFGLTYSVTNETPTASAVAIEGLHYPDETITGKYAYADKEDDPEGLSNFQWFRGNNATGSDKNPIPGAIGLTYTVQTLDAGKYLFFEVQPVASRGNLNLGIRVLSSASSEIPTLQSIFISNPASKLSYYVGDTLDITGLAVTGNYSDNSTKLETITAENITGFDSTAVATDQILTITIGNKTTNYTVQIAAVTLQSIAVTTPANKLLYFVGDALDISGLAVTGTYSNGSTRLETITAANITGFDNTAAAANQILTITVDGKTTTYTVQIAEKPADECFIATAAFGSKFEPSVALLRDFRDQYLLTNNLGAAFVNYYYQKSPPIAATIASSEPLKIAVRVLLAPAIAVVYMIYHPILGATVLALFIVFLVFRLKSIKIH